MTERFYDAFPSSLELRCTDVTLVSATSFSSSFSLSWEEALAVALPSWVLILSSSSSSFSRSWSKVWAQLSHSGTGQQKMTPCYYVTGGLIFGRLTLALLICVCVSWLQCVLTNWGSSKTKNFRIINRRKLLNTKILWSGANLQSWNHNYCRFRCTDRADIFLLEPQDHHNNQEHSWRRE